MIAMVSGIYKKMFKEDKSGKTGKEKEKFYVKKDQIK